MSIVQRIQDILLKPQATWPRIESEPATVQSIYVPYVVVLAAVSALAGFVGLSIFGVSGMGARFRVPIFSGLIHAVVGFVMTLVMVYVMSLIADALAPRFGGQKNPLNALKLTAYGSTAGILGGLFALVPSASMLGMLAGLYSIYLIYLGLPVLMKCAPDKAVAYTALLVVCGLVAGLLLGWASTLFGGPGLGALR